MAGQLKVNTNNNKIQFGSLKGQKNETKKSGEEGKLKGWKERKEIKRKETI